MSILLSIDRYIRLGLRWAIILLMISMTVIVFLQVVFRYLWDAPLGWSEEVSRFLFVWVTFLAAANLVRIVLLFSFVSSIVVFCSVMFFIGGYGITVKEWIQLSPALQIEMGWIYLVIPVATALMIIWAFVDLISTLSEINTRRER